MTFVTNWNPTTIMKYHIRILKPPFLTLTLVVDFWQITFGKIFKYTYTGLDVSDVLVWLIKHKFTKFFNNNINTSMRLRHISCHMFWFHMYWLFGIKIVIDLVLVKDFNVFIWITVDGPASHGYLQCKQTFYPIRCVDPVLLMHKST